LRKTLGSLRTVTACGVFGPLWTITAREAFRTLGSITPGESFRTRCTVSLCKTVGALRAIGMGRAAGTVEPFRAMRTVTALEALRAIAFKTFRPLRAITPCERFGPLRAVASFEALRTITALEALGSRRAPAMVVACSMAFVGNVLANHACVPAGAYRSRPDVQACRTGIRIVVLALVTALGPVCALEPDTLIGTLAAREAVVALAVATFATSALLAASLA